MRSDPIKTLIEEFPELGRDDVILTKEVYAHFGLLFFKFALVEHSLINIATFAHVGRALGRKEIATQADWERMFDEGEKSAKELTVGNLIKLTSNIPEFANFQSDLKKLRDLRNYFAHHFMREEASLFSTDEGCWLLLSKMQQVAEQILSFEEMLKAPFADMCQRMKLPVPNENQIESGVLEYISESNLALKENRVVMGWEK